MADEPPSGADLERPLLYRRCEDVRETPLLDRQSSAIRFFLRTPEGEVFIVNEQDHFIWSQLDGTKTFAELESAYRDRFGLPFTRDDLAALIADLFPLGLIEQLSDEHGRLEALPAPPVEAPPREAAAGGLSSGPVLYPSRLGWRARRREPFTIVVGNPDRLFRRLAAVFWPLRRAAWVLLPLTFMSILIMIKHSQQYAVDWLNIVANISWWPTLWVAEHVQNALTRVVEGIVVIGYGGQVLQYRIRAFMGVLLRAFIDESSLRTMPLRCQLWAHASTLLVRLTTFNVGIWVWVYYQQTQPFVSKVGLYCSVLGAFTLFITACPLIPQEGYHLIATALGRPDLMHRAWRLVGIRLQGRPAPADMSGGERWGMMFFGLGIALFSIGYVGYVWIGIDVTAVQAMGGFGALLVLAVFVLSGLYFYSLRKFAQKMRAMQSTASTRLRSGSRGSQPPLL